MQIILRGIGMVLGVVGLSLGLIGFFAQRLPTQKRTLPSFCSRPVCSVKMSVSKLT